MNNLLRKTAVVIGLFLLGVSIFWSQDGFNFNLAGDSGGSDVAVFVGWGLAISVSVVQFVFSTNYRELNASLITFGVLAYVYSIYTNYQGITHFQGEAANSVGAWILGFVMDGVPEPLIAWGLRESLSGDFIGNLIKAAFGNGKQQEQNNRPIQKVAHKPHNNPARVRQFPRQFGQDEQDGKEEDQNMPVFPTIGQARPRPKNRNPVQGELRMPWKQ